MGDSLSLSLRSDLGSTSVVVDHRKNKVVTLRLRLRDVWRHVETAPISEDLEFSGLTKQKLNSTSMHVSSRESKARRGGRMVQAMGGWWVGISSQG